MKLLLNLSLLDNKKVSVSHLNIKTIAQNYKLKDGKLNI